MNKQEPWQIALLMLDDWRNFVTYCSFIYIFTITEVTADRLPTKTKIARILWKLYLYPVILIGAYFLHLFFYRAEYALFGDLANIFQSTAAAIGIMEFIILLHNARKYRNTNVPIINYIFTKIQLIMNRDVRSKLK